MVRQLGGSCSQTTFAFSRPDRGSPFPQRVERLEFKEATMSRNTEHLDERIAGVLKGGPAASTIHLTLQGKGGVGKSLVASILAQYFRHHGREIRCIDSDPVNQTF